MSTEKTLTCALSGHSWGDWDYISEGSCEQARYCQQCCEKDTRTEHPDDEIIDGFKVWQDDPANYPVPSPRYSCDRCSQSWDRMC